MSDSVKDRLKRTVVGTPLEPMLRRAWQARLYLDADRRKGLRYDAQTIKVMRKVLTQDSSCVDVGCHRGVILMDMLRLAPRGSHLAFEPLPDFYEFLAEEFAEAPATIYPYALAQTNGESTFEYVVNRPAYSGLRRRPYPDGTDEKVSQITVQVRRLDEVAGPDRHVEFIKVDVEGGEVGVIAGGQELIRRSRPIVVFEHGRAAAAGYDSTSEELYDLLADCGLEVYLMATWLKGGAPLGREGFLRSLSEEYYFLAAPVG